MPRPIESPRGEDDLEMTQGRLGKLENDFRYHSHRDTSSQGLKPIRIVEYDTDLPAPPAGTLWMFNDSGTYKLSYRTKAGTTKRVTLS